MSMDFFRNKRNSIITIVVFGFIILTFIFWGFYHKEDFSQGRPISVNGEEISTQDFNRAFQNRMNQFSQFYGGKKMSGGMEELIRKQTAKGLVMRLAMAQEADSLGLIISDEDIKEEIKNYQAFKNPTTGNFSPEQYRDALTNFGYTPARFEKEIRQDLMVDRLQSLLDNTLLISTAELVETKRIQDYSFTLDSAVFTREGLSKAGKISISDAEAKSYFEKNQPEFMHPERRILELASLPKATLESKLIVSEEELKSYFETKLKNSSDPQWTKPRARARHILVSQKGPKGKAQAEKIKTEIETLAKSLSLDEAFGRIARQKGEDYGSAAKDGDLGYFVASTMDRAFADAVFDSKKPVKKIVGPVESQFGNHLILVLDRTNAENTFGNRKVEVESLVRAEKIRDVIRQTKEAFNKELANKSTDSPKFFTDYGIKTTTTAGVSKTQNDAQVPFVLSQKAFSASPKLWAEAEEFDDSIKFFRVVEIVKPKPMTFEEARAELKTKLEDQKTEELVKKIHADLIAQKLDWKALSSYQASLKREANFKAFSSREVPGFSEVETVLKAASALQASQNISSPIFHEGQWVIFKGSDFKEPNLGSEAELKELRTGLQFARKSDVFDSFVEDLIKKARIPKSQREAYGL